MNDRPHHHLVCTACKAITDVEEEELGAVVCKMGGEPERLPGGFLAERFAVDVLGRCVACQSKSL
jgi:Fe2+ or Zn2+ uptake regulation protein